MSRWTDLDAWFKDYEESRDKAFNYIDVPYLTSNLRCHMHGKDYHCGWGPRHETKTKAKKRAA